MQNADKLDHVNLHVAKISCSHTRNTLRGLRIQEALRTRSIKRSEKRKDARRMYRFFKANYQAIKIIPLLGGQDYQTTKQQARTKAKHLCQMH